MNHPRHYLKIRFLGPCLLSSGGLESPGICTLISSLAWFSYRAQGITLWERPTKRCFHSQNFMPVSMIGTGEIRIINSNAGYHYVNDNHIPGILLNVIYLLMLNLSQQPPSQVILLPPCYRWVNWNPHWWSNLPKTSIAQSLTDNKLGNWDVNACLLIPDTVILNMDAQSLSLHNSQSSGRAELGT